MDIKCKNVISIPVKHIDWLSAEFLFQYLLNMKHGQIKLGYAKLVVFKRNDQ